MVDASAAVTETAGRLKKIGLIADCLRAMDEGERAIGARYLAGEIPQKTNIGYATASEVARATPPASEPQLSLREVDARLDDIAKLAGPGSAGARKAQLGEMLARATPEEQTVWMSHRDSVVAPPEGAEVTASTDSTPIAAFEAPECGLYGGQFHT